MHGGLFGVGDWAKLACAGQPCSIHAGVSNQGGQDGRVDDGGHKKGGLGSRCVQVGGTVGLGGVWGLSAWRALEGGGLGWLVQFWVGQPRPCSCNTHISP